VLILFLLIPVASVWAEQGKGELPKAKPRQMLVHPAEPVQPGAEPGVHNVLKKLKLVDHPTKTIGAAFDGYQYFSKRDWKETPTKGGKIYVDFTGWFKQDMLDLQMIRKNISSSAVEVKFVIEPNGSYAAVMVTRIEIYTDGKLSRYPVENINGVLTGIYENRKINFK
jgi:hypothetical protein